MSDETREQTIKRKSKDSVFTKLFSDPDNVLELYRDLHPEDTTVTKEDIEIQTLSTVFVKDIFNDLGFIVNENGNAKLVMLVEAQSTWNPNMTMRMLFYLVETYRRYVKETKQSEHSSSRVNLPKPELYIVYSGNKEVPSEISFNDDFFGGEAPIDLRVKILSVTDETLYGQYIGFCKVYDEQRKLYDNSIKCIEETIRICLERGYLAAFLSVYKREGVTMMSELFDEQAQREQYEIAHDREIMERGVAQGIAQGIAKGVAQGIEQGIAQGVAQGIAQGVAQGEAKGKVEGIMETLVGLVKKGILTIVQAADEAKMSVSEFEALTGLRQA